MNTPEAPARAPRSTWAAFARYLRRYKSRFLVGFGGLILVDVALLATPLLIRQAVNLLVAGRASAANLAVLGAGMAGLGLFIAIMRLVWRWGFFTAARLAEVDLRADLYAHWLRMPQAFFRRHAAGDLMAHATNDVEAVRFALAIGLVLAFDAVIHMVATISVMLALDVRLSLLVLLPIPLLGIAVAVYMKRVDTVFEAVQDAFSAISEAAREGLSSVRTVRAFAAEGPAVERLARPNRDHADANIRQARMWGAFFPFTGMVGGLGLVLLLAFGGPRVLTGEVPLGDYVAISTYVASLTWPLMAVGWTVTTLQRGFVGMRRLEALFAEPAAPADPPQARRGAMSGRVEARELSFRYEGAARPSLSGISFELPPGGTLGIVGRVGSGKSSLLRLLLRLESPPPQSLFVDGTPVEEWGAEDLRRGVAWVGQQPVLFSDTLRENVRFGVPPADDAALLDALHTAGFSEDLRLMGAGLDTLVGERGVTLSGGQRQRVALARALLLDSPVLVLDDVLSAVDAQAERRILDRLRTRVAGRTLLIASHRLSAVRGADLILVLENGRVLERGRHEDLFGSGGFYRRLWDLQGLAAGGAS